MNAAPSPRHLITMEYFYSGEGRIVRDAWVVVDENGLILEIGSGEVPFAPQQHFEGLVWGGMVNAHCHLELSHLHGQIPERTGMAGFVQRLQAIRGGFTEEDAMQAAEKAVEEMFRLGIRGVGDICNGLHSLRAKQCSESMFFHSFVEVFGLSPSMAEEAFQRALGLSEALGERASVTLHAPYSVSTTLRDLVQSYAEAREWPQSLHLLESKEERQLFESLDGPLMEMIRSFKAPFPGHVSPSPVDYLLPSQPKQNHTLLVHLVELKEEEAIQITEAFDGNAFAVICPRANLFIHGTLPPVDMLRRSGLKICIGTDSLAGNWSLDLWAEMRLLQTQFDVPISELLTWAVDHGTEALRFPKSSFIPSTGGVFEVFQMENYDGRTGLIPADPVINLIKA